MTTEPSDNTQPTENQPTENSEEQDDLTRIRGIGQVKQQWLQELLNIRTIQELAIASVEEITAAFAAAGRNIFRREVEEWVTQARTLITESSTQQPEDLSPQTQEPTPASAPAQPQALVNQSSLESLEIQDSIEDDATWETITNFTVTVQTRRIAAQIEHQVLFYDSRTNITKTESGINYERIHPWIMAQVSQVLPVLSLGERTPIVTSLAVSQIHLFQPPESNTPITIDVTSSSNAPSHTAFVLVADQPFTVALSLRLSDIIATPTANQPIACQVIVRVRNLTSRTTALLGDPQQVELSPDQLSYTVQLPETQLTAGMYRLQVVATLAGIVATPAYLEIPLLQVV